jgi:putative holliday junction resolvase
MRIMGIDFGTKKLGIALSDDGGTLAFPKSIIMNDSNLIGEIKKLISENEVGSIVIGESVNNDGVHNDVMKKIIPFKEMLEEETGLSVHYQKEFMTSVFARHAIPEKQNVARKVGKGVQKNIDDSAAALILQRYLDWRKRNE